MERCCARAIDGAVYQAPTPGLLTVFSSRFDAERVPYSEAALATGQYNPEQAVFIPEGIVPCLLPSRPQSGYAHQSGPPQAKDRM